MTFYSHHRYIVHRRRNSSRSVAEVPVEPMNWITPLTVEESNGAVMPLGVQSRSPQDGYITSKTFKPSEEQQVRVAGVGRYKFHGK